ncbi:hypothetical protein ACFSM5_06120 [Lacibacterium aquatile]|uniref:Sugar O-methyltransferase n=1 Tax=Lacibacterium aquatile TaxID=1168082 RepID=A0ABW5DPH8_9PROT
MGERTSISNLPPYREMTLRAIEDDAVFETFRIEAELASIYEVVGDSDFLQGFVQNHLDVIGITHPDLLKQIEVAALNELCGSAPVFPTEYGVELSAATARYFKYLADLLYLFKSLAGFDIIEVGGAYGGFSSLVMNTKQAPRSYTIFDLPEVNQLAARYHDRLGVTGVTYKTSNDIAAVEAVSCDLFISTHAISELTRPLQIFYIDKIVRHAKHGYILYNHFFETGRKQNFDIMTVEEFASFIPGARLLTSQPLVIQTDSHHPSTLIFW